MPVVRGGSVEADAPNPLGDYAMSCLGRERIFEHFSREHDQPMALVRLNYAVDGEQRRPEAVVRAFLDARSDPLVSVARGRSVVRRRNPVFTGNQTFRSFASITTGALRLAGGGNTRRPERKTSAAVRGWSAWASAVVTADVPMSEGARLKVGQRVRAFSPESRSRMHQATVSGTSPGFARAPFADPA